MYNIVGHPDFEIWLKVALEKGRLSLKRLSAKDLEVALLYWGPWVMKGRLWDGHLSSWGLSWATWSGLVYWRL